MAVPVTAVNEHRGMILGQNNIRTSGEIRIVKPKSETRTMQ